MQAILAFLARHARWALPAGAFTGILLPDLAALLRPLVTAAVLGMLAATLLRLDWGRLARALRQPGLPLWMASWQLVASPLIVWAMAGLLALSDELRTLLVLQAAAPPVSAAALFAMLLGFDGVLALLGTFTTILLLPLTLTPLVALLLPHAGVEVDLGAFFLRVTLLIAAPFVLAWAVRRVVGAARLARNDELVAGLNIALLVVFVIGVMDGVSARLLAEPQYIGKLLLAACVSTALLHLAGYLLFRAAGTAAAYAAAITSGNRNMGLMLAVTGGTVGEAFSLYVALVQIPMYFAPLALAPFLKRRARA